MLETTIARGLLFRVFPSILAAKFQREKKRMVNLHGLEHTCSRGAVAVQSRYKSAVIPITVVTLVVRSQCLPQHLKPSHSHLPGHVPFCDPASHNSLTEQASCYTFAPYWASSRSFRDPSHRATLHCGSGDNVPCAVCPVSVMPCGGLIPVVATTLLSKLTCAVIGEDSSCVRASCPLRVATRTTDPENFEKKLQGE